MIPERPNPRRAAQRRGLWHRLRTRAITDVEHTRLTADFDRSVTDDHMAHPSRYRDGNTEGDAQS